MYTDPDHIRVEDPGKIEGNIVFSYLDIFSNDQEKVSDMKAHYQRGGLGDVAVKRYLIEVLNELLTPIRERRERYANDPDYVRQVLLQGSASANVTANQTLREVRAAIGLNYFGE